MNLLTCRPEETVLTHAIIQDFVFSVQSESGVLRRDSFQTLDGCGNKIQTSFFLPFLPLLPLERQLKVYICVRADGQCTLSMWSVLLTPGRGWTG